jgi:hypothetical protein
MIRVNKWTNVEKKSLEAVDNPRLHLQMLCFIRYDCSWDHYRFYWVTKRNIQWSLMVHRLKEASPKELNGILRTGSRQVFRQSTYVILHVHGQTPYTDGFPRSLDGIQLSASADSKCLSGVVYNRNTARHSSPAKAMTSVEEHFTRLLKINYVFLWNKYKVWMGFQCLTMIYKGM